MKNFILISLFPALLFSCGNNTTKSPNEKEDVTNNQKEEKSLFKNTHVLEVGDNLNIAGFNIKVDFAVITTELPAILDNKVYANGYFLFMAFTIKNESSRYKAVSNAIDMHVVNSDGLVQKHLDPFSVKVNNEYENFDVLVVPEGFSKRAYAVFEIPDKSRYYLSFMGDGGRTIASLENIIK